MRPSLGGIARNFSPENKQKTLHFLPPHSFGGQNQSCTLINVSCLGRFALSKAALIWSSYKGTPPPPPLLTTCVRGPTCVRAYRPSGPTRAQDASAEEAPLILDARQLLDGQSPKLHKQRASCGSFSFDSAVIMWGRGGGRRGKGHSLHCT